MGKHCRTINCPEMGIINLTLGNHVELHLLLASLKERKDMKDFQKSYVIYECVKWIDEEIEEKMKNNEKWLGVQNLKVLRNWFINYYNEIQHTDVKIENPV